jgi:hypothetical protein
VLFPIGYWLCDPKILEIVDYATYQKLLSGDTSADTAFYPVFVLINGGLSHIFQEDYVIVSLVIAIFFYFSSIHLFVWRLGKSFSHSWALLLLLLLLVSFSYYSIKVAFAFKKVAIGLTLLNLSLLTEIPLVSILLRFSSILAHPQLTPLVFLPSTLDSCKITKNMLAISLPPVLVFRQSFIRIFAISSCLLIIFLALLSWLLSDFSNIYLSLYDSLLYKASIYILDRPLYSFSFAVPFIGFIFASIYFVLLMLKSQLSIPFKSYLLCVFIYVAMVGLFGTSRLFFVSLYLLYPLRNSQFARVLILCFLSYSFYRTILAWSGLLGFSGLDP